MGLQRPPGMPVSTAEEARHRSPPCTRELAAKLSDFRSRTHPEFGPADATRCHSLLLAGQAILGADLREWLFVLVTACGRNASGLSL
jgi:hypothetical protein